MRTIKLLTSLNGTVNGKENDIVETTDISAAELVSHKLAEYVTDEKPNLKSSKKVIV